MTRDHVEKLIDGYITLEQHPGWDQLVAQIRREAEATLSLMKQAKTGDELVRHTQTYITLLSIPEMPKKLYQTLQAQLQAHVKK
jgi:hypothetical protein